MSTGKHTPGPWTPFVLDTPLADVPAYVARCIEASKGANFLFVGAGDVDVCHVGNGPRGDANARLIAAAPDLLECLKDWVNDFAEHLEGGGSSELVAFSRAAIAKATGVSS